MRDYYEILEADRNTSDAELKKKYRKLAMQYHPDKNPGDEKAEAKFREIGQAYEVLKDPEKKAAYDRYGHAAFEGNSGGPGGAGGGAGGFSDIFEDLFGDFAGGGGRQAQRGGDLRFNIDLDFKDAYSGLKKDIKINTYVMCSGCKGSGGEEGAQPMTCGTCNGAGKVRSSQGFFMVERACPKCGGNGQIINNPCRPCSGEGRVQREKTINVKIPAGVDDGTRIRVSGEGEAGPNGTANGDLYLFVQLRPHSLFNRDGSDLLIEAKIPMTLAALGGVVDVPTPEGGRVRVTIPEGTQSGHRFRLRGKGMPVVNRSNKGDLYVDVYTEIPVSLSKKQRKVLQELQKLEEKSNHPDSNNFINKVEKIRQ
jgi:molecular chaperone DnaJ|tara:strand:- start:711 stop:1811 length:1101 start_codon:yes stop_codon:yes gene_type:complete